MTVQIHHGQVSLYDATVALLRAGLDANLEALAAEVTGAPTLTTVGAELTVSDARQPRQGSNFVEVLCQRLDAEDLGAVGRRLERWRIVCVCGHRSNLRRTDVTTAPPEEQLWRLAGVLARAVEVTLRRGLPGQGGCYDTDPGAVFELPQDPRRPEAALVRVEITAHLEVYDAMFTPAP